jgi:hypothetical protein
MSGQTVILAGNSQRDFAKSLIDMAPQNAVVNIKERKRSNDQNALMWVLLSDISRAKPNGRHETTDTWKAIFMDALNFEIEWIEGLNGRRFPHGHSTSKLKVSEMNDLIELIYQFGAQNGVQFSEKPERNAA